MYCNKCGYPFPQNQPRRPAAAAPTARPVQRTVKRPVHRNTGGGFLSFGTLITEHHLKLIYILGAVLIVLVSVMGIAGMFGKPAAKGANVSITNTTAMAQDPAGSPLFWIGFLVIGSILWRMFCELFALLSRGTAPPITRMRTLMKMNRKSTQRSISQHRAERDRDRWLNAPNATRSSLSRTCGSANTAACRGAATASG